MHQRAIGSQIYIIDKYFKIFFRSELKPLGLNAAEGMVLLMFFEKHQRGNPDSDTTSSTQEQIIHQLHYDKAAMTRTMQSLEGKGHLERIRNPLDQRSFLFSLTESGDALKPKIVGILKSWNDALLKETDPKDLERMGALLEILSQNALEISTKRKEEQ